MAKKINFTQAAIDRLPAPAAGRAYYADAKTAGLYLCVWDSGVKSFELYRRIAGRPTRLKIGRFPEITVDRARKEAVRMAGEAASGKNPADARRKVRGEMTFGQLFALYLDNHAKPHKRSWQGDEEQYNLHLKKWAGRKLSAVRKADVAALHARLGRKTTRTEEAVKDEAGKVIKPARTVEAGGPYCANRVLALLSAVFNYAATLGYEGGNPAKGVKKFKEQSRDRFMHADEIRSFFAALNDPKTPATWQDFFTVALLTGARRANVAAMKWADLELTRGLWRIPEGESKNKEPLLCVLAPAALEILQRRAGERANKPAADQSEFVFPSYGASGHIEEPKKAWREILDRAGLKNLRLHDLRRTLGSWQAATGASLSIIGRSLGHKNVATTAIYARLDLDPVRASVNTAAAAILSAANGGPADGQKALPAPADVGDAQGDAAPAN